MDKVTIEGYRCFRERQTAHLAPLTLLVGENSTGKTSFLAMVRILWQAVLLGQRRPSFNEEPFDLGSFREIVNQYGKDDLPERSFCAGFAVGEFKSEVTFRKGNVGTEICEMRVGDKTSSINWKSSAEGITTVVAKSSEGSWHFDQINKSAVQPDLELADFKDTGFWGMPTFFRLLGSNLSPSRYDNAPLTEQNREQLRNFLSQFYLAATRRKDSNPLLAPPVATAPVRSRPRRTYNLLGLETDDPEGAGVPEQLAALANSDPEQWETMKSALEHFGQRAGIFDEIAIRPLGDDASSDPFRIQVRKDSHNRKGQWRNLIDVGYGVSQILPVIFELVRPKESSMLLLQQPEVHLHPSAQAGLGSILCSAAATKQQILVETHSDHLIDRVRMDARDRKNGIKPEDVSILYFERSGNNVQIHSIEIGDSGNIVNQPPGYRDFFRCEVNRSLGL